MWISEFQLNNYKSYLKSETLKLSPGINVIVGRNHAGKTALLEGLGLHFPVKGYRSSKIKRSVGSQYDESSWAVVSFGVVRGELLEILRGSREFSVPLPSKEDLRTMEMRPEIDHVMQFIDGVFSHDEFTFQARFDPSHKGPGISHIRFPSWGMYDAGGPHDKRPVAFCKITDEGKVFINKTQDEAPDSFDFGIEVAGKLQDRIYSFRAERFALASAKTGNNTRLEPDASNLAEVLENLQGRNPGQFRLLNSYLRDIFPQVYEVSVRHDPDNALHRQVIVYEEESLDPEEKDAIPLSDSGAGVGQVLAMLYVLITSKYPQVIVIDEPQNFLHPGAVRKLFEIFNVHAQHQYIIATHLPNVIAAADPATITLVQKKRGQQSTFRAIDKNDTEELRLTLHEVGARLGDVFGADKILWVEGPTERDCFPLILQKLKPKRLRGTEFVPVLSVDEILGKEADRVIRIYENLSKGRNLLPPAIGFIFDRECRLDEEIINLERCAKHTIKFIKRRMYENYLLKLEAIEAILLDAGLSKREVSASKIEKWLEKEIKKSEYYCPKLSKREPWVKYIDGSKLLHNLFTHFSKTTLSYKSRKVEYGFKLTKWLLDNDPGDHLEIANLIYDLLPEQ
jgi:predicted ATPase